MKKDFKKDNDKKLKQKYFLCLFFIINSINVIFIVKTYHYKHPVSVASCILCIYGMDGMCGYLEIHG